MTIPLSAIPPSVSPLKRADDAAFADFYRIYATSISPREQKTRHQMEVIVASKNYRSWVARQADRIVGMAVFFTPEGGDFALLEYMAVDPDVRSSGVGAAIFRAALDELRRHAPDLVLLLEVDSDRDEQARDLVSRRRRKAFYRRLGCRTIAGCDYLLPLPGQGAPPVMDLMLHHPADVPIIQRAKLERWLQSIFRDVYACSEHDPRISRMVTSVSDPITLGGSALQSEKTISPPWYKRASVRSVITGGLAFVAAVGLLALVIYVVARLAWLDFPDGWDGALKLLGVLLTFVGLLVTAWNIYTAGRTATYTELDNQYQRLLAYSLDKPFLRSGTRPTDKKKEQAWDTYAFMIFNFLETVIDRCDNKDPSLMETWTPVLLFEGNLYYKDWWSHANADARTGARAAFKDSFVRRIEGLLQPAPAPPTCPATTESDPGPSPPP